ncbi:MAG: PD-(D/E)XK nuclease family protein [Labilithrix sp.]|nr:PD-(D/E)XK nuclease family protein [Labilithrix sp.]
MVASEKKDAYWKVRVPVAWPAPPPEMSVSTHADIDECPRRWALGAAEYPDVWSGRGYPPRLQMGALEGNVVHLALEVITRQLTHAGVPSLDAPIATSVLKDLGGFTHVVEECVERLLKRFANNPRAIPLMEYAQRTLRGRVPSLRARVQSMLARLRFTAGPPRVPAAAGASKASTPSARSPLMKGTHPEVELRAKSIGWKGKADLLALRDAACEITDFKTGIADEAHKFQVRVYAVLWRLDDELNPSARIADRLVLAYEGQDVEVEAPREHEIGGISNDLLQRRRAAEAALTARPPPARPTAESCRYCEVRQLCDAYWAGKTQAVSDDRRFGDCELKITGRHGPTSWDAVVVRARDLPAKTPALLRLSQHVDFAVGARVRVLDGALARDPDDPEAPIIVTLGTFSEAYRME